MADKKSDLRVVRTRNALRAAFEELIAETTLDKITVKALTDRAGINRKTFYLHYETIEAFYDEIMNGIMDEFFEYYEKTPDDPWDMDGHARRFFRYLAAQPPMIEQLVCSPSFYDFGERIYATQMNRYRAFADELFWREGITSESEELICPGMLPPMGARGKGRSHGRGGPDSRLHDVAQRRAPHEPPARERLEQRHLVGVGGTVGRSGLFLRFQRHRRVMGEQVPSVGGAIQPRQGFRRRQREGHAAVNAPHHGVGLAGNQHEAVAQTQSRQQKRRTVRTREPILRLAAACSAFNVARLVESANRHNAAAVLDRLTPQARSRQRRFDARVEHEPALPGNIDAPQKVDPRQIATAITDEEASLAVGNPIAFDPLAIHHNNRAFRAGIAIKRVEGHVHRLPERWGHRHRRPRAARQRPPHGPQPIEHRIGLFPAHHLKPMTHNGPFRIRACTLSRPKLAAE